MQYCETSFVGKMEIINNQDYRVLLGDRFQ